jgi:hypothetical protein
MGETPIKGLTQNKENIMAKAKKLERRTIIGKVVSISPQKIYDGEPVVNVDVLVPGSEKVYVDLAFWGMEAIALLQGKKLNDELTDWVQFQPRVTKGARVRATGSYKIKSWKATKSKKIAKVQKKGQIAIYSHEQLTVVTLPVL